MQDNGWCSQGKNIFMESNNYDSRKKNLNVGAGVGLPMITRQLCTSDQEKSELKYRPGYQV